MKDNLILDTDSYKAGHFLQWPQHTTKASKKGYLDLIKRDDQYFTVKTLENKPHNESQLVTVFETGKILKEYSLEEVRKTAASSL